MDKQQLIEQLKDIKHDVIIAVCSIDDLKLSRGDFGLVRLNRHLLDTNDKLGELVKQLAADKEVLQ